jgi:hypothetical protein
LVIKTHERERETKKCSKNPVTTIAVIGFFGLPNEGKKTGLDFGFWTIRKMGKRKNLLDERHGETNRRGVKSSSFILKKSGF